MALTGQYGSASEGQGAFLAHRLRAFVSSAGIARTASVIVPRITEILLVLILGICIARIVLIFLAPLPLPHGEAFASTASNQAGSAQLAVKSPFPATLIDENQPVEAVASVAETTLDLKLTGIWADEDNGSATIRTPDGKQARYAVGDTIVSGVILDAVYGDRAIISRDGVRESLRFESKVIVQAAPRQPVRPHGSRDPNAPPTSVTSVSLGALSSVMRMAPSLNGNGQLVIEVYASRNRNAFSALGFQDGDRIVSINGAATPTDPARLAATMNWIQRQENAELIVERSGETFPLRISLADIGIE